MVLTLLDYKNNASTHDIGKRKDIAVVIISVISGDERAIVVYKNGEMSSFDTCYTRSFDFHDGDYVIYNAFSKKNAIDDPKFLSRKTSYEYFANPIKEDITHA